MTQTRKWMAAAAVLTVLVLLAGWFLLVSPKRGEAAEIRGQAQQQEEGIETLRAQLEVLQGQADGLSAERKRLAELTAALPDDPRLPDLVRTLTKTADHSGADLVSIAPGKPVDLLASAPGATPEATPAATPEAAGAATDGVGVLKTVPLTLEVSGRYVELERFLNLLEKVDRPILVGGFALSVADAAGPATATPAPQSASGGLVTMSITGSTFMVDRAGVTGEPTTTTPGSEAK